MIGRALFLSILSLWVPDMQRFDLSTGWRGPAFERRIDLPVKMRESLSSGFELHAYSDELKAFAAAIRANPIYVLDEGTQIVGYGVYVYPDEPDEICLVVFNLVFPISAHPELPASFANANLHRGLKWLFDVMKHHGIEWDAKRFSPMIKSTRTQEDRLEFYSSSRDFYPQGLAMFMRDHGLPIPEILRKEAGLPLVGAAISMPAEMDGNANALANAAASAIGATAPGGAAPLHISAAAAVRVASTEDQADGAVKPR